MSLHNDFLRPTRLHNDCQKRLELQADSNLVDNFYGWRGVDYWMFVDFQWNPLKMGVLVPPQLGPRYGAALPGAFFSQKNITFKKKHDFLGFSNDFWLKWTWFAIKSRNHYQNRHPDPYRILVGTLNPWNGRPRVVPWPILFERFVPKRPDNHHYFRVCREDWFCISCQYKLTQGWPHLPVTAVALIGSRPDPRGKKS